MSSTISRIICPIMGDLEEFRVTVHVFESRPGACKSVRIFPKEGVYSKTSFKSLGCSRKDASSAVTIYACYVVDFRLQESILFKIIHGIWRCTNLANPSFSRKRFREPAEEQDTSCRSQTGALYLILDRDCLCRLRQSIRHCRKSEPKRNFLGAVWMAPVFLI